MELWFRWSWLLVVLLCGLGFSSAYVRQRRQSDTRWRGYQPGVGYPRGLGQPVSGVGSPRGLGQPVSGNQWSPVSGFGASRGVPPQSPWGSRYPGAINELRQVVQPASSLISVQCAEDQMVVTVQRDFYGNGYLIKTSELTLGSCQPGSQTSDEMVFNNNVEACGASLQLTQDFLIYRTILNYNPVSSNSIIRANPAAVPIMCYYPRHGNVSSKAIIPTWAPFSTTVSTDERLAFSMYLMTDDWSSRRSSSVFQLGDLFYIEASVMTENHIPMILFVDSCVATATSDVNSSPSYQIIAFNGCLVDGTQDDSSSAFISPRSRLDKIQFTVDAFRFIGTDASTIYITCSLRATRANQTLDPMNKACSYNKNTRSWSALEGSNDICRCCDSGTCAPAPLGQARRWGRINGGSRGIQKRETGHHLEEHSVATLGPLLVIWAEASHMKSVADNVQPSRVPEESPPLEMWMLVAIGSVSVVVVAVAIVVISRYIVKSLATRKTME
ncbi:zona pellucida sperm-binding protein 3-like [Bufo gargarizans]|uniref:zona pellucida sperm-binding protein 3-like n=1 Tax=Bufo gargarizans TaxID=30331 RepID=UPI001CF4C37D|nr:zona pellucida sperm-binding protein 3-like [Bufo gargarizans]